MPLLAARIQRFPWIEFRPGADSGIQPPPQTVDGWGITAGPGRGET